MGRPLRILLVEDHLDTQQMMRRLLSSFGHMVQVAATMADALSMAQEAVFDLVICDVGLPDGSGIDLMKRLHAERGLNGIALSGYEEADQASKRQGSGFVAHLTKPVKFEDLEAVIGRFSDAGTV